MSFLWMSPDPRRRPSLVPCPIPLAVSKRRRPPLAGSRWVVPDDLYPIIAQDAVLLKTGADNPAARAFLAFLKGPEARAIKEKYGYGAGE